MGSIRLSFEQLVGGEIRRAVVIASPKINTGILSKIPFPKISDTSALNNLTDAEWVVVVGGGALIDRVKYEVREHFSSMKIVAIPSLWGSGAHLSPVVVLNESVKRIFVNQKYLPDAYILMPELGQTVSPLMAKISCGDVWSHVIEGFLSPLATSSLRAEASEMVSEMLELPLSFHPDWFELGGRACALQARSSVGLIHGIAHVLEPILIKNDTLKWGHARLCSVFLLPVMRYNLSRSDKAKSLFTEYSIDLDSVLMTLEKLFDLADYNEAITQAITLWPSIIRDQCSRTNCVLVRKESIEFFDEFGILQGRTL